MNFTSTLIFFMTAPLRRGERLSPLSVQVDAGADTHGAQLPAGKAILRWFGHKTKGTIVGLLLRQRVEILPLSLPVGSIRFSWRNTFNPVQDTRLWRHQLKQRTTRSQYKSRYSHLSLCIPTALCWLCPLWPKRDSTSSPECLQSWVFRSTATVWSSPAPP